MLGVMTVEYEIIEQHTKKRSHFQRLFETNLTERNNIYVAIKWRHTVDIFVNCATLVVVLPRKQKLVWEAN